MEPSGDLGRDLAALSGAVLRSSAGQLAPRLRAAWRAAKARPEWQAQAVGALRASLRDEDLQRQLAALMLLSEAVFAPEEAAAVKSAVEIALAPDIEAADRQAAARIAPIHELLQAYELVMRHAQLLMASRFHAAEPPPLSASAEFPRGVAAAAEHFLTQDRNELARAGASPPNPRLSFGDLNSVSSSKTSELASAPQPRRPPPPALVGRLERRLQSLKEQAEQIKEQVREELQDRLRAAHLFRKACDLGKKLLSRNFDLRLLARRETNKRKVFEAQLRNTNALIEEQRLYCESLIATQRHLRSNICESYTALLTSLDRPDPRDEQLAALRLANRRLASDNIELKARLFSASGDFRRAFADRARLLGQNLALGLERAASSELPAFTRPFP